MVISGFLLQADIKANPDLAEKLRAIKGLEIIEFFSDSQIGLVLEARSTDDSFEISSYISSLEGVKHLSLIYHNFEEETCGALT